ncbi:MAG TPA: RHS repeat-associated core domain-containing protein [Polyangiaceae bacterium]|nr:RHS repeat-associated core domain-containing protein [Polyangiaceae bacterium]
MKQATGSAFAGIVNLGTGLTIVGQDDVTGDVWSVGSVQLNDRAAVNGFLKTAGTLTRGVNTTITGLIQQSQPLPPPTLDTVTVQFQNGASAVSVANDSTRTLSPGDYAAVSVGARAILALSTGDYRFDSLTTQVPSTLRLTTSAGPIRIFVRNTLNWNSTVTSAAGDPTKLLLGYVGSSAIIVNTPFTGTLLSPNAAVTLPTGSSPHNGAFFAKSLSTQPDVVVTTKPFQQPCQGVVIDDGNACTTDACDPITGVVSHVPVANGVTCSDGDACTTSDSCQAGVCVGANPVVCTAQDQCHSVGVCAPATGQCSNPSKADGTSCSDGSACTQSDSCQAGACVGANPVTCTAQDQCHSVGTCDATTGLCSNPSKTNGTSCSDGNACTQSDTCQAGACVGASPVLCAALDQCHSAGTCDAATGACSNPALPDGSSCSDGNACTQLDSCQAGACVGTSPIACSALDQCHVAGSCNPGTGVCSNPPKTDGSGCSDSNACTQADSCQAGVCVGGNPVVCAALDQCHLAGVCNSTTGVCSSPAKSNGSACSDGNSCTQSDACQAGTCVGGSPVVCVALDQCHLAGSCDASSGTCSNPTKTDGTACNDSNACTAGEACSAGVCQSGTPAATDDGNPCTADACDPLGGVTHTPVSAGTACDDSDACNGHETCNALGSCNAGTPLVVDDGNPCTTDSCSASTGVVSHVPAAPGTLCGTGSCSNGTQTLPGQCDAAGSCSAGTTISCAGFACDGTSCFGTCASDAQCQVGFFCDTVAEGCLAKTPPNGDCTQDQQCAAGACVDGSCCDPTSNADPLAAVTIDPSRPTDFATQVAPLYAGPQATQKPVAGTIVPAHVAVIRGKVLNEAGQPLPCAKISVPALPGLGATVSRADGAYSLAVNGGAMVTIRVELPGYLTADRAIATEWNAYATAPNVRLQTFGTGTLVSSTATGITVASGAAETDGAFGTRTGRLLVPPGTHATIDGITFPSVTVQVKDLTNLAKTGRDGMPATLPVTSAFTYAVSLSVQGAENKPVALTDGNGQPKAVPFYVENFLSMPNGEAVPVGYYDVSAGQWVASDNGLVLTITGVDAATGEAQLDLDATVGPESTFAADALGILHDERVALANLYPVGTSLWRFTTTHFSAWDANFGWGPPPDAQTPANPPPVPPDCDCCDGDSKPGSIVDCQKQGVREKLPIAGTPFDLYYSSSRQRAGIKPLRIPLVGSTLPPANVVAIELEIQVAGRFFTTSLAPPFVAGQTYDFVWDGKDASGRRLYGAQSVHTRIGYTYPGSYQRTPRFGDPGSGLVISASKERFQATLWQEWSGFIDQWDAQQAGLGGWDIDVHHGFDQRSGTLHLGNGQDQAVAPRTGGLMTLASNFNSPLFNIDGKTTHIYGPLSGGGANRTGNGMYLPNGVLVDTDGTVYFAESGNDRLSKLNLDGSVTVLYTGLKGPGGLAFGPDHKIYIADTLNDRVVQFDLTTQTGVTVAGNGREDPHQDGPALQRSVALPVDVAISPDGTLYIAESGVTLGYLRRVRDGQMTTLALAELFVTGVSVAPNGDVYFSGTNDGANSNGVINKISPDGTVKRVAGGGSSSFGFPEGVPALNASMKPLSVRVAADNSIYYTDASAAAVRRVSPNGIVQSVAGTPGVFGSSAEDGSSPLAIRLSTIAGITLSPDGGLYMAEINQTVQKLRAIQGATEAGGAVPSSDGERLYYFDLLGRHLRTVDAHTGILQYAFRYDAAGFLTGISDRALDTGGRETIIHRDANEVPLAIEAPFGQLTLLTAPGSVSSGDNYLTSLTDPENGTYAFSYFPGGQLQTFQKPGFPSGSAYHFTYSTGLLSKDEDPLGHSQTLQAAKIPGVAAGWRVTHKDQLGRSTIYDTQLPDRMTLQSTITHPDQLQVTKQVRLDGLAQYQAPDSSYYSAMEANPSGSSAFWQTLVNPSKDPVHGVRVPMVTKRVDIMGSGSSALSKVTVMSRTSTLATPNNLSSILSSAETKTINNTRTASKVYDAATRRFTITSPAGRKWSRTIDTFGRTTSFQVDGLAATTFGYDDSTTGTGQIAFVDQVDGALQRHASYSYFGQGQGARSGYLASVAYTLGLLEQQRTSYAEDSFGRTLSQLTGSDGPSFAWDGRGNLKTVTPSGDTAHQLGYSLLDQLLTYTPPSVAPSNTPVITTNTYTFDRKLQTTTTPDNATLTQGYDPTTGKLVTTTIPTGVINYDYYPSTPATGSAPGRLSKVRGPYGVDLAFTYLGDLMLGTSWSGGVTGSVTWTYDKDFAKIREQVAGKTGSGTVAYGYDPDKLITCASPTTCSTPGSDALVITYDSPAGKTGLINSIKLGSLTEAYGFDKFGRLQSKTTTAPSGAIAQFAYDADNWPVNTRRDALGRIVHKEETILGSTDKFDYTYSPEGWLTDVTKNGAPFEHYGYSSQNGSRVAATTPALSVAANAVVYDAQDRLTQYGPLSYTYTNNGELKTKTDSRTPGVTQYSYDVLGNLLSVTPASGPVVSYVADGLNRRVAKKVGTSVVQQWLYRDGLKPVAELDGSGALVSMFVYASNRNVPDYVTRGGKTYRIITDQLGSPRLVVNVADATDVPFRAVYTAFGEATITGTANFIPFGFAGGLYDSDTGLVRFGARDYDPTTGRWTSKDPKRFNGGQANLYLYVGNDPINRLDPSGRDPSFAAIGGAVVAGAGTVLVAAGTAPIWGTGLIIAGTALVVWDMYNDDSNALDQIDKTKEKLHDEVDSHTQHENDQLKEFDDMNDPNPPDDEDDKHEDSTSCQ